MGGMWEGVKGENIFIKAGIIVERQTEKKENPSKVVESMAPPFLKCHSSFPRHYSPCVSGLCRREERKQLAWSERSQAKPSRWKILITQTEEVFFSSLSPPPLMFSSSERPTVSADNNVMAALFQNKSSELLNLFVRLRPGTVSLKTGSTSVNSLF